MKSLNAISVERQNGIFADINTMSTHLRLPYGDDMRYSLTPLDGTGITNIVFCGMGGSALAANLAKNWLYSRLQVPLEVVRGSVLPGYVNEHSLVIISSYSGDTTEALAAYEQANKNNVQMIVLTNGGQLMSRARAENRTMLSLPSCDQPRFAIFAGLRALTCALQNMGLISEIDAARELEDAADFIDEQKMLLSPDIEHNNQAKLLAEAMVSKQIVIYATPLVSSAAYIWKISLNEDAKQLAWYNTYSELDHNELEGWQFPKEKEVAILQLSSQFETPEMQKRVAVTTKLLNQHSITVQNVALAGKTSLQELLFAVILAGFSAGYLALLNDIDPIKVKEISKLKAELGK